jgi:hypothetical protein
MGTTLKTKWERRTRASSDAPVRNSSTPCMIHEALLSPGCTLADKTIPGRRSISAYLTIKMRKKESKNENSNNKNNNIYTIINKSNKNNKNKNSNKYDNDSN